MSYRLIAVLCPVWLFWSWTPCAAQHAPAAQRKIRRQENKQKSVAALTVRTARELKRVRDEYGFNRVGRQQQIETIKTVASALERLADPNASEKVENMPWIVTRLAGSRGTTAEPALRSALLRASQGQKWVVDELAKLLSTAQGQFGKLGPQKDLRALIKEQKRLKAETEKLGDETLGKTQEELTEEEKADLEKIAEQQKAVQKELEDVKEDLKALAEDLRPVDPAQARAIEANLEKLDQHAVGEMMLEAGENIENNQMHAAQQQQQQILDLLKETEKALAAAAETPLAQLEQQLGEMQNLVQRQQQLLAEAEGLDQNSTPMDFNELQADQAGVQGDLGELMDAMGMQPGQQQGAPQPQQGMQAAHQDMAQAQQQLGQQARQPAAGAMESALKNMMGAQQAMAQQLAQMLAQMGMAAMPGQPMPGQPMPGQPQMPGPPTMQSQFALNVMPNMNFSLNPKDYQPGTGILYGAQNDQRGPVGWQVSLEPKEREVLATSTKEKFPRRYERLLSLYYRTLAASRPPEQQ